MGLATLHLIISGTNTLIHNYYDNLVLEVDSGIESIAYVSKDEKDLDQSNNTKGKIYDDKIHIMFSPGAEFMSPFI